MLAIKPMATNKTRSLASPCDTARVEPVAHLRLVSVNKMTKKYIVVRDRIPSPLGGFIEAFRMALVEFTNMGERHFDLTGYPHNSEAEALMSDWGALGADFATAAKKIESNLEELTDGERADA